MHLSQLLLELKSGFDDLRLIDPNHLYADLLDGSIKAIKELLGQPKGWHDEKIWTILSENDKLSGRLKEAEHSLKLARQLNQEKVWSRYEFDHLSWLHAREIDAYKEKLEWYKHGKGNLYEHLDVNAQKEMTAVMAESDMWRFEVERLKTLLNSEGGGTDAIKVKDAEFKAAEERYQSEIKRLNELLAVRTRDQTVLLHGRKYSAAELLDIVKAGEDRARDVAGMYDLTVAKHAEALRKINELEGVAEQCRIYRDRAEEFGRRADKLDETCKALASLRDEAIEEVCRLRRQLQEKSESDASFDAIQPRSFFAMPGFD